MNVFLVGAADAGVDAAAAGRALERAVAAMAPFELAHRTAWSSPGQEVVVACAAHAPELLGGVEYLGGERDRVALFAGRPFRWTGTHTADGQGCLDPRTFLAPASEWADTLDGRCAVVRYDTATRTLEVFADPVGTYPVHTALHAGTRWVSNSVEALRLVVGSTQARTSVLASVLGAGWPVTGQPLWEGVDRLARGLLYRFGLDGSEHTTDLLSSRVIRGLLGGGFDAEDAAAIVAAAVGAAAGWPGRPDVLPTTAGKDSRIIFEAALLQGVAFTSETVVCPEDQGYPVPEDAAVGRELCERAGISHSTLRLDRDSATFATLEGATARLRGLSTGGVCFNDVRTVDLSLIGRPVRIIHKGIGGEIARSFYGLGRGADAAALSRQLTDKVLHVWPKPVLAPGGRALVEADIRTLVQGWLDEGVEPIDIPDVFYFESRVAGWGGSAASVHEAVEDTALALCSRRILPHLLGLPAEERARERFHADVLVALQRLRGVDVPAPALTAHGGRVATARRRLGRAERLGRKATQELNARAPWSARTRNAAQDPFVPLLESTRERVAARPDHEAWSLLDAARVQALLRRHPRHLDARSRLLVSRLATVFMAA